MISLIPPQYIEHHRHSPAAPPQAEDPPMRTETFEAPRQLGVTVKLPRGDMAVETMDAPRRS